MVEKCAVKGEENNALLYQKERKRGQKQAFSATTVTDASQVHLCGFYPVLGLNHSQVFFCLFFWIVRYVLCLLVNYPEMAHISMSTCSA